MMINFTKDAFAVGDGSGRSIQWRREMGETLLSGGLVYSEGHAAITMTTFPSSLSF